MDKKIIVDDKIFNMNKIVVNEGWENRSNLVSYQNQPAMLEHEFNIAEECEIIFVTHPYSGHVKISQGGKDTVLNLYSIKEGSVSYKYETGYTQKTYEKILAYISLLISIFILIKNIFIRVLLYHSPIKNGKKSTRNKIVSSNIQLLHVG